MESALPPPGRSDQTDQPVVGSASSGFVRKYLSGIFLAVSLIVFSAFLGFSHRSSLLLEEQLHQQAVSFFEEVLLTREWAARHGGVYVKLEPGVSVDPYLSAVPGLDVVITDEQGTKYTLRNPALMTREISEIAAKKGLFQFRITSLKPLNPNNAADAFETEALRSFERGASSQFRYEQRGAETVYRFMGPLVTDQSCLQCHAAQGYRVGDIRGGISVAIPATTVKREVRRNWLYLTLAALGVVTLVFGLIQYISNVFVRDLKAAERRLVEFASRDFLTGLFARREALRRFEEELSRSIRKGTPLSVMLLDIDRFKQFNDTYGHAVGDAVLAKVGRKIAETLRKYDIICRWGGEEFLAVTPDATLENAVHLAERLQTVIGGVPLAAETGRDDVRIAISAGVAQVGRAESVDQVIARADAALRRAKAEGRECVVAAEPVADAGAGVAGAPTEA